MMAARIVCCAAPHGYGPASKLCRLASALRRRGVSPVFLGTGIALELAERSGSFDDVIDAPPESRVASALIDSAAALVSLMDQDYLRSAQNRGKPTFVADSLFWMRDRIPDCFRAATRYWVQNFFGVRERLAEAPIRATIVGPMMAQAASAPDGKRSGIVIHLGGCDSSLSAIDSGYFNFVVEAVAESAIASRFSGPMVVMAGRKCIDALGSRIADRRIERVSVAPDEALALLAGAQIVLTAPGLTATLECFQLSQAVFFLPPQNYSQWWILKKLRLNGLAPAAFHWEDCLAARPVTERMTESDRVPLLRSLVGGLVRDAEARRALVSALDDYATCDRTALAAAQRRYFDSLGANGLDSIVGELAQILDRSAEEGREGAAGR